MTSDEQLPKMTQDDGKQNEEQKKHQDSTKSLDQNDMDAADGKNNHNIKNKTKLAAESQLQSSTNASRTQNSKSNSRSRSKQNLLLPKNTKCTTITKKKKSSKASKEDNSRSLQFIWICVECKEAECVTHPDSPLLVCEGPCRRPFHYPCAGLPSLPPADEMWVCNDCTNRRHECCVCHEYGYDDVDVHKCDKRDCGLFYHEACLNMYDVDILQEKVVTSKKTTKENDNYSDNKDGINIDSDNTNEIKEEKDHNGDNDEITKRSNTTCTAVLSATRPKFICPAHACWTCSGGPPPLDSSSDPQNESNDKKQQQQQQRGRQKRGKKRSKKVYDVFTEKKGDLFVSISSLQIVMIYSCSQLS